MTTLLVSADARVGNGIADALERLGEDVMWCRGPSGADSTCAAVRGKRCPLTSGIDAVVVDTWLTSDQLRRGFGSSRLVEYYERLGVPVIALLGQHDPGQASRFSEQTVTLSRHACPMDVSAAVQGTLALRASKAALGRPA
jgi:hypothetical protein